jgi:hypothetical protein
MLIFLFCSLKGGIGY